MTKKTDHDLLIEVATKLEQVRVDISELKNNFASRVAALESEKVNNKEFEDFKVNVKPVIDNFYKIIGGLIVIQTLVVPIVVYIVSKHLAH